MEFHFKGKLLDLPSNIILTRKAVGKRDTPASLHRYGINYNSKSREHLLKGKAQYG